MPSIFTKILNGEMPGNVILQDEHCFALLDIHPVSPGHTLVIPKKEVDRLFDLDEETYAAVFACAKKLAPTLQKVTGADRIGVIVEGFAVPHAHVHLVPIDRGDELSLSQGKEASAVALAAMAEKIMNALNR